MHSLLHDSLTKRHSPPERWPIPPTANEGRWLTGAINQLVDGIRINSVSRVLNGKQAFWIKTRRSIAQPILKIANRFFDLAQNPIQALDDRALWQEWEVHCFAQLHANEDLQAGPSGASAVWSHELPGRSLSSHIEAGTLSPAMLEAAGRELHRCHQVAIRDTLWSHGDCHTGNLIYDPSENRARVIDFEVRHRGDLSSAERHADDLLVFLQDLLGRRAPGILVAEACHFLTGYGSEVLPLLPLLLLKLEFPQHLCARLWWGIRTTHLTCAELRRRLELLRIGISKTSL